MLFIFHYFSSHKKFLSQIIKKRKKKFDQLNNSIKERAKKKKGKGKEIVLVPNSIFPPYLITRVQTEHAGIRY